MHSASRDERLSQNDSGLGPTSLLRLDSIKKSFGGVYALRGVTFEVARGEVHALLGQNGAGKSTLIKILAGVTPKDGGHVAMHGKPVDFQTPTSARAAGIAVVYQELSLIPSLSVAANMFLNREPHNPFGLLRQREMTRKAQQFFDDFAFPLSPNALVGDLPFAYRQLTEIAKALIGNVDVLVLDEPTGALSEGEEHILFDAIANVTKRGAGVIYVTHRLHEVLRISNRITVLRDGTNVGTFRTADTSMKTLVAAIVGRGNETLEDLSVKAELGCAEAAPLTSQMTYSSAPPLLELENVSNARLNGVTLSIEPKEIVGLAGMVGSGRTEILETIFGVRRVASGEIRIGGNKATLRHPADAIASGLALVPEDRHEEGLILDQSIESNIALPVLKRLQRFGFFRKRASGERARKAVRELSVRAPHAQVPTRTLSGGNQQKVVFGKWQNPGPALLLLDEPTIGVDVGAREEIYNVVRTLAASGSGILVVSSDLVELLLLCDRIAIVADGRIIADYARQAISSEEQLHHLVQEANQSNRDSAANPDRHNDAVAQRAASGPHPDGLVL